jgi:hypothetical protein
VNLDLAGLLGDPERPALRAARRYLPVLGPRTRCDWVSPGSDKLTARANELYPCGDFGGVDYSVALRRLVASLEKSAVLTKHWPFHGGHSSGSTPLPRMTDIVGS